jgi:hypothetical protein
MWMPPCSAAPSPRRAQAGLVVGDDELAVGVELEAVDDPADDHTVVGLGAHAQLDTEHRDAARVFELEVAAEEHLGVGVERWPTPLR